MPVCLSLAIPVSFISAIMPITLDCESKRKPFLTKRRLIPVSEARSAIVPSVNNSNKGFSNSARLPKRSLNSNANT